MNRFRHGMSRLCIRFLLICVISLGYCGCATPPVRTETLPPILAQDELLRPYEKAGTIEVHRDLYGAAEDLSPADYSWAYNALRHEAARIGADAVIFPEVHVEVHKYLLFYPTSHITARGIAIKFR